MGFTFSSRSGYFSTTSPLECKKVITQRVFMPYLSDEQKSKLDDAIIDLTTTLTESNVSVPGGLNYIISQIVDRVVVKHGESYSIYNTLLGSVEAAKLEIYRRLIAPYEDTKIKENGDVFAKKPKKAAKKGQQKLPRS